MGDFLLGSPFFDKKGQKHKVGGFLRYNRTKQIKE